MAAGFVVIVWVLFYILGFTEKKPETPVTRRTPPPSFPYAVPSQASGSKWAKAPVNAAELFQEVEKTKLEELTTMYEILQRNFLAMEAFNPDGPLPKELVMPKPFFPHLAWLVQNAPEANSGWFKNLQRNVITDVSGSLMNILKAEK